MLILTLTMGDENLKVAVPNITGNTWAEPRWDKGG
jgi:hypothetical protein